MKFSTLCTSVVAYVFFGSCNSLAQAPKCSIRNKSIVCSSIDDTYLLEEVSELNITNSYIPLIEPVFFERLPNLNKVVLRNVHLRGIMPDAFSNLTALKYLNLGNNNLDTFNISTDICLEVLDLSDNNLQNLSDSDIGCIKNLKFLDISNNNIKFLPSSLLEKLKTDIGFTLVSHGNPWNCNLKEWVTSLNQELTDLFCNRKPTGNCQTGIKRTTFALKEKSSDGEEHCPIPTCFKQCLFWFFGAIWIGVIIGNVCKIKKLLCSNIRHEDKTTQYGNECYNTFGGII
ncbi:unnamed protein product [Acanthoscelides obtectus]|uniref:Uncharacterized protein n=1 Tax=Acanthoscelides obtectus TaxID=200917 RepID=A0A9P0K0H1_ACAOB|nr:unnamed protein product [Acanthoscelides obtectus]CAK1639158.1 Leucine-rich repeat-containing protein 70 [Acanthoscelides obtectus]